MKQSKEHNEQMAALAAARKEEAALPEHTVKLFSGWRKQHQFWLDADDETRADAIAGLVFYDGMIKKDMSDISRFFGVEPKEVKPYIRSFLMAAMALKAKIQRKAISMGLQREDQINLVFNLLLQYCEQVMNPVHEGVVAAADDKKVTIEVVTKESIAQKEAATIASSAEGFVEGPARLLISEKLTQ